MIRMRKSWSLGFALWMAAAGSDEAANVRIGLGDFSSSLWIDSTRYDTSILDFNASLGQTYTLKLGEYATVTTFSVADAGGGNYTVSVSNPDGATVTDGANPSITLVTVPITIDVGGWESTSNYTHAMHWVYGNVWESPPRVRDSPTQVLHLPKSTSGFLGFYGSSAHGNSYVLNIDSSGQPHATSSTGLTFDETPTRITFRAHPIRFTMGPGAPASPSMDWGPAFPPGTTTLPWVSGNCVFTTWGLPGGSSYVGGDNTLVIPASPSQFWSDTITVTMNGTNYPISCTSTAACTVLNQGANNYNIDFDSISLSGHASLYWVGTIAYRDVKAFGAWNCAELKTDEANNDQNIIYMFGQFWDTDDFGVYAPVQVQADAALTNGESHTVVLHLNQITGEYQWYVDPNLALPEKRATVFYSGIGSTAPIESMQFRGGNGYSGQIDYPNFAIFTDGRSPFAPDLTPKGSVVLIH